ncbi:MAG TPA: hypothetical protein VGO11_07300 [Chthoniobacteraceae bacterium]|jgi:hypothetical protein|nr:hypothetical protein [Chthoniobacteraceae bacterium]
MKPYWRAFLFFLPPAALFGVPALLMGLSGEFTAGDTVVARQQTNPQTLLGLAYSDSSAYVKARRLAQVHPEVLALGNSRVMQFRSGLFRPGVRFYNAGGAVSMVQDYRVYLERLAPADWPRFLLIAADDSFFHPSADGESAIKFHLTEQERAVTSYSAPVEIYRAQCRKVWADLFAGKIEVRKVLALRGLRDRVGMPAVCHDQGYRADGSYRYPALDNHVTDPRHRDYQFAHTLSLVQQGAGRFAWGSDVSQQSLQEFDRFLDFCQAHRIHVIGFSPPSPHAVCAAMQALGEKYAYVPKVHAALQARLTARGFEYYDLSDFTAVQAPDDEAIDGFHGSERTYLRLVIHMLEHGSRLNEVADLPHLREVLRAATKQDELPYGG